MLYQVYGNLRLVEEVVRECEAGGPITVPALNTLSWIQIEPSPSKPDPRLFMLDAGERDTISAALSARADLVLIDERLGRNLAEYHGLRVVGTLGTLLKATRMRLLPAFLPEVRKLQEAGFWYDESLVRRLAALVNETA